MHAHMLHPATHPVQHGPCARQHIRLPASKPHQLAFASWANACLVQPSAAAEGRSEHHLRIDAGADVNAVDQQKKSAMVYAAAQGHTDVVARLLKAGVDVNARYPNELTALMWAAGGGHPATVKFLLDAGADTSLKDNRGKTALDIADETGKLDVKKVLSAP